MDYLNLLAQRKSTRKFTPRQLTSEELKTILTAADNTPVGSNLHRDIHLTVVQDRAVLDKMSEAAVQRWQDKAKMKEITGETQGLEANPKKYDPFYNAPTVIFVSHRKQNLQPGIEFANVAIIAFSMHLAATALGLGSVIMWFALESMREIPELDHTSALKLPAGFEPLTGLAIGQPVRELSARELKADRIAVNYL